MEQLKNITEFVVVSNLENRALNAGINKAQNWWKNRQNHTVSLPVHQDQQVHQVPQVQHMASSSIQGATGELALTVLRAEDLHESRLSALTSTVPKTERPYVVVECNRQRFQTNQTDLISTHRNPQWTSNNGPFVFKISNLETNRLTVWIQQQDPLRIIQRNEPKTLGMSEISVKQLIDQEQIWLPLRKDNRPAGQVLLQITFNPREDRPPAYKRNF